MIQESEFWLALGKAILAVGLIAFTFITMVGGNPLHDVYGFRNWDRELFLIHIRLLFSAPVLLASKVQGAPFAEFIRTGNIGKFMGFLACFIQASYTIAGPEYVSMTAGEAMSMSIFTTKPICVSLTHFAMTRSTQSAAGRLPFALLPLNVLLCRRHFLRWHDRRI